MSRPSGSALAPRWSETPTSVAPFWARKRAACCPTAPNPSTTTRAPSELETGKLLRRLGRHRHAKPSRANLIQGNAAKLTRQSDGASDLVVDPRHSRFVGPHVGAGNIIFNLLDGRGESADGPLLLLDWHLGIADNDRLCAAVPEASRGILRGHRPGKPDAFLNADVGRHASSADGGAGGNVVDDDNGLEMGCGNADVERSSPARVRRRTRTGLDGCANIV